MLVECIKDIRPLKAFSALRRLDYPFILYGWRHDDKRHSYASAMPFSVFNASGYSGKKDAFDALSDMLGEYRLNERPPFPFSGGICGYFAYDLKDTLEPFAGKAPHGGFPNEPTWRIPRAIAGFYDPVYVYDHEGKSAYVVSMLGDEKRFKTFLDALKRGATNPPQTEDAGMNAPALSCKSNFTKEEYINAVNAAKEYIAAGDIYQINLSQRLEIQWHGDLFGLYSTLTKENPALFSSFLDFGDFKILSCSPERLLKISGDVVATMPIKGTRPRGGDRAEDILLLEELRSSRKEAAEHVMIVDLERNDLGMICATGTVEVPEFMRIEAYPHLYHMVSTVRGRLKKGISSMHALKKIFPGGSVTGAPKIRAMEIIDALEKTPRGVYTGAIGWAGFNGDMDMSMAIRTAVCRDNVLDLRVGGGIVADSEPELEYSETLLKASDFFKPLGIKENG